MSFAHHRKMEQLEAENKILTYKLTVAQETEAQLNEPNKMTYKHRLEVELQAAREATEAASRGPRSGKKRKVGGHPCRDCPSLRPFDTNRESSRSSSSILWG